MSILSRFAGDTPATRALSVEYGATSVVAALTILATVMGIASPQKTYPNGLHLSLVPNDIVTLAMGPLVLVGSMILASKSFVVGFVLWPSSLLFMFYNYLIYAIGAAPSDLFIVYLLIGVVSVYALIGIVASLDSRRFPTARASGASGTVVSIVLIALGVILLVRTAIVILSPRSGSAPVDSVERATWIADFFECPALLLSGLLLLRGRPFGFIAAAGMLAQFGLLSIGLIPLMILRSIAEETPLDVAGVLVVVVFAAVPIILLFLLLRGRPDAPGEDRTARRT